MLDKLAREPLFHFLLAGFLLFVFFDQCTTSELNDESRVIHVTNDDLLTLIQYRSKAFNKEVFGERLEKMSALDREQLIQDFIREEALFREAKRLGLDENDYIIKRRMIQKVDFIYENQINPELTFERDSLLIYYDKYKEKYRIPDLYTFSHIFFRNDGIVSGLDRAKVFLNENGLEGIDFNASLKYGDRFLYHRHYVEKTLPFIRSQFGQSFTDGLIQITPNLKVWQGPIQSDHGYHLVLITEKEESLLHDFEDIEKTVQEDYRREFELRAKETLMKNIIDRYEVRLDLG